MADDDEVGVKVTADATGAKPALDQTKQGIEGLGEAAEGIMGTLGDLKQKFIDAFSVKEIAELIDNIADLGEQAIRTAKMLGMSAEEVQKLGFAAKMVGGSSESMAMSMMRLERNMAEAQDGTSKAAKAFDALGISQQQLKNSSPDQILGMIADAFARTEDGAAKTAIAMDLMGRGGAQMIPLLDQGSEGLQKMGLIGEQTGSILTTLQAEGLEKTAQKLTVMKASVEGVGISLVEVFKPAIDAIIDGLTALAQVVRSCVEMIRVLADLIEGGLAIAIAAVITKFEEFGVTASNALNNIKTGFVTLGTVIDDVIHGHFEAAADAWVDGTNRIRQANSQAAADIAKLGSDYDALKTKIENATLAALTFGNAEEKASKQTLNAPTAGGAGKTDNTEEEIKKNNLATELEINKLALQDTRDTDAAKVASGKMNKLQEIADLKDFALQEKELNLKALDDEAQLYDEDSAQYKALMNKKKILTAQYNNEIDKLNLQAAETTEKQQQQMFSQFNRMADQSLTGILQGTQTWQQAMSKIFSNLLSTFIEDFVVKKVEAWVMSQAQIVGLTQAFNSIMIALGLEQATTTAAAQAAVGGAAAAAKVASDAAVASAGVFANQAPLLGPAASVPAAAAYGEVMTLTPQASFDVGAWNLNSDMVAQLHQGEMVVPEDFASGIRSGGGGIGGDGGTVVNFTVQAVDQQSVANLFKNNGQVLAQVLATQSRLFNKNAPGWRS